MNNNSMLIPMSFNTTKIIVAHFNLDLFLRGYYQIQENPNSDKFNEVKFVNSVFINKENNWIDSYEFGFQFNCNYGGTGPSNLVRFLSFEKKPILIKIL